MPFEISILSYSSIFILHINNRLGKVEDNIYHLFLSLIIIVIVAK